MALRINEPSGLERAYCEECDATFTFAKGRCTGCIRREENRKQGVVHATFGAGMIGLGGVAFLGVGGLLGLCGLVTAVVGAVIALRGVGAIITGRSAE